MTTRVVIGDCILINGDCLEVMADLDPVDHVITDPPYESHMHDAKRGDKVVGAERRIRIDGHASPPPLDFECIDGIREQACAVIVQLAKGWALIFCTPEGVAPWRDAIEASGARYKKCCFFIKPDSAPQFNGQGPATGAECFVTAWCGPGHSRWNGRGKRGVYTYPVNPPDRDGRHPTEKPRLLMLDLVSDFTNAGEMILDPFMGSGTTGVACVHMGRKFIGVEKNPKHFEIACERISAASRQPDMLITPPAKPEYRDLEGFE